MTSAAAGFAVNTYSYIFDGSAADTVAKLADQGYGGVELMFFPGHLWPSELDAAQLRGLRDLCEQRLRLVAVNMPNVDMNIAAAAEEMRAYTLDLLTKFVRCAGELGAGGIIVGPGKANPLFPMPRDRMISHFCRALDTLAPLARQVGTRLLIENMPFAFLPDAEALMNAVDGYGDDSIRVIYDVANAHFIGESPDRRAAPCPPPAQPGASFRYHPAKLQARRHRPRRCSACGPRHDYERNWIRRATNAGSYFAFAGCRHCR